MSKDWERIFEDWFCIMTQVVYGSRWVDGNLSAHCWLRLHKFNNIYEFESTSLRFKNISKHWNINDITKGWINITR